MKRILKQGKAITLVSLVVTIIVLIILAGVSINLILGENGLIEKAKETKPIVDIATAQEKLELVKGPVQLSKYGVNLDDYLEELDKVKEKYEVDYVEKINEINAEIIIGGKYKFLAIDEENGNVKIVYQGEAGKLKISPTSGTIKYPETTTFEVIENESGGELTVKSENENIAKASINGTIVTVMSQNMTGTAKIIVRSAANGEYAQGKATYTAIVENGVITLTADAYTGNYDGQDHDAVSNVVVTPSDAKLEYSIDEGTTFSTTIPKVNGATTYSVIIKASKAGYATKTITKTITVGKNTETGNLVISPTSGIITYPNTGTFNVTKNTSGGTLSVTSSNTNVATASIDTTGKVTITPKAITTDNQKVTITVKSAATSNYTEQTKTYTATIKQGTMTLTADAYTGNYDGQDHDAVSNVVVTPSDAKLEYSIDEGTTFTTTIPKVNGATTYSVIIKASKAGYATKTITKTIIVDYITIEELRGKDYVISKTIAKDSNGNLVRIPEGFKVAEDSGINVTEGIVIEDNDIISDIGNNRGNQYVWIPVGNEIKKSDGTSVDITLGRYTFASDGKETLQQSAENYTEEILINNYFKELAVSRTGVASSGTDGLNTTALNLKGFIDSVKENGGYYIARYEASYGTDGKVNSKVSNSYSETTAPTAEGTLWNNITQINAAIASRNLYTIATTDLINSYAWDTAIVYIQNFSGDTDYSRQDSKNTSLANTGANGDEVCKINDMASNTGEWTTEYSTNTISSKARPCIYRGGYYFNGLTDASYRYCVIASVGGNVVTFRSMLYM